MLLPDPLDPTSAVVVPAGARKLTSFRTGTPSLYSKLTFSKRDLAVDRAERRFAAFLVVLGLHLEHLVDAIEPGERLAHLRPDRRDLHDRRRHQAGEQDVGDELADGHLPGDHGAAADDDHHHADRSDRQPMPKALMPEMDVIVFATFRNKRWTPVVNTSSSRFSAV